jgi:hypothetical protein
MAKNDKNRGFIARDDFCFFALEANRFSERGRPISDEQGKGIRTVASIHWRGCRSNKQTFAPPMDSGTIVWRLLILMRCGRFASTGTSYAMQMSENAHKLILISPPVIDES